MRIDPMTGAWIGAGEDATYEILSTWYGRKNLSRTVKFSSFRVKIPWGISKRQEKETIDLVLKYPPWTFCIRLQDRHHKGQMMPQIDAIQKAFIEEIPYHKIIDIHQDDAPSLFNEETGDEARLELWLNFLENGVLMCPSCHTIGRSGVCDGKVFCDYCGKDISIDVQFIP